MSTYIALLKKIDRQQKLIDDARPFDKSQVLQLKEYYRIGLTYTSTALEGNTLTLSETKVVLEDGITINGKPLKDHLAVLGHSEAFDYMWNLAGTHRPITEEIIKTLHAYCMKRERPEIAGIYRDKPIFISGTDHNDKIPSPADLAKTIDVKLSSLNNSRPNLHPVEYAANLHLAIVQLHPFEDGNGRTARLAMNLALRQDGYPIVVIPPVVRHEYIQSLEKAWTNPDRFTQFIAERVDEAQRELMRNLHI
ncbi:Fic family protein [Sporolituus thermophilus]|uniref:Fic/DOC family protein n=1 Tax=Sporolituus thermophilus DSM 23256 TaxID=1123285 RepID=A0A1G7K3E5_9FIRM|nr:Fic family protein [Sporolituus thermophilus]SDF31642.1 Fic/DOC family protein [Sporolituus thermophilus DSM 23256]